MRQPQLRLFALVAGAVLVAAACTPASAPAAAPASQATAAPAAKAAATIVPAAAAEKMTVRFSHVVAEETPKGKGALKFAELVKQKSGGNIDVQVYANSSLYKDAEEFDALQKGQVEFLAPSTAKFSTTVPEWQVLDLPNIFGAGRDGVRRVAEGPVGQELYTRLNKAGMQGLAIWDNGFRYPTNNKRPLKTPEDFKGLKFRAQGKVEESIIKALGGGAQVMAFSEVFGALQQGVIDGQMNSWSNSYTQKFHEVQKYATTVPVSYLAYAVVTNKDWWDKLKPETRKIFEDSMKEATAYVWDLALQENNDALAKIKASGRLEFYEMSPAEQQAFFKALQPVYDEFEPKVGKDIVEKVRQAGA